MRRVKVDWGAWVCVVNRVVVEGRGWVLVA